MTITLRWTVDATEMQALFDNCPRPNLLQSPAWGRVKQSGEGWAPHWAVVEDDGRAVATVQVLARRFGPFSLARLNRGPLWQDANPDPRQVAEVLSAIRRKWGWRRLGVVLAAPELTESPEHRAIMAQCGFHRRSVAAWSTGWLDLACGAAMLRKRLNAKWRTALTNAERNGLATDVLIGAEGMEWLLPQYLEMQKTRGFSGIPAELLQHLAANEPDDIVTIRVRSGETPVSAVLMTRHGRSATYAIGWSNPEGRRLKGNFLALWVAAEYLRGRDCHWMDLGGIDAVNTPGIAEFKTKMNSEAYTLVGEYWAV
ncbi:GNAT family N-acetyltransferase [Magnetospirillum sp. 64-120]|uniref:lipid II:glycine glycyltransferase FemX n=1 Tax=Magnetospirillum sp. 64-120 TaxID=1895778 RepID=UPI00092B186D|nr:GNAT family N-acetyltransferase [Magnetospirillum sp. 64-120]OJX68161.1 MAG: hypothetical protein BGO92_05770 [Magnetospirillum sp. 64-120]